MLPITFRQISHQAALAILIPMIALMTGCDRNALFEQVQGFSTSAEPIEQKFPDLATDIYDSCLRTAKYNPLQAVDSCQNY